MIDKKPTPETIEITNHSDSAKLAVVRYEATRVMKIPAWRSIGSGKSIRVELDTLVRNLQLGFVKAGPTPEDLEKEIKIKEKEIAEAKKLKAKKLAEAKAKKKADEEAKKLAEAEKNKDNNNYG